jgi:hypothetical protein
MKHLLSLPSAHRMSRFETGQLKGGMLNGYKRYYCINICACFDSNAACAAACSIELGFPVTTCGIIGSRDCPWLYC